MFVCAKCRAPEARVVHHCIAGNHLHAPPLEEKALLNLPGGVLRITKRDSAFSVVRDERSRCSEACRYVWVDGSYEYGRANACFQLIK